MPDPTPFVVYRETGRNVEGQWLERPVAEHGLPHVLVEHLNMVTMIWSGDYEQRDDGVLAEVYVPEPWMLALDASEARRYDRL